MKNKYLRIRLSERRLNKLRSYAVCREKTMTQIIEEYIDELPEIKIDDSSPTLQLRCEGSVELS